MNSNANFISKWHNEILGIGTFLILTIISFLLPASFTGDNGDSIVHYFFAADAPSHPYLYFNHWAKPFFTLITSPFAQFGFKGMVFFNILCFSLSAYISVKIIYKMGYKYGFLVYPILFFAPLYFQLVFSGLTEYLFALMTVWAIYLFQINRKSWSMIVVSFLPLVRSEGLIILLVFAFVLLIYKHFKLLPWLLLGQLVFNLVGMIYHEDFLWIFTKIAYNNLDSPYGNGAITDFIFRLAYVIEKPIYLLLILGLIMSLLQIKKKGIVSKENQIDYLLVFCFAGIFIGHTIFWWQGIFNSMGLPRVLNAVVPVIAIIAVLGLNRFLLLIHKEKLNRFIIGGYGVLIILFPFFFNPNGLPYNKDFFRIPENELIDTKLQSSFYELYGRLYASHPYVILSSSKSYHESNQRREIKHAQFDELTNEDLIIWDSNFSKMEEKVSLEMLQTHPNLKQVDYFSYEGKNHRVEFYVFRKA